MRIIFARVTRARQKHWPGYAVDFGRERSAETYFRPENGTKIQLKGDMTTVQEGEGTALDFDFDVIRGFWPLDSEVRYSSRAKN